MSTAPDAWDSLLRLAENSRVSWGALFAFGVGLGAAVLFLAIRRRVADLAGDVAILQTQAVDAKRQATPPGPTLQEFSQQLMDALGMELPASVAGRYSANDPSRFVHALAIYTRAQRRKLVALYHNAEALREQMASEAPPVAAAVEGPRRPIGEPLPPVSGELEALCRRAESLMRRLDEQLRDRHQLILNDIFKAEAKRLELQDALEDMQVLVAGVQETVSPALRAHPPLPRSASFAAPLHADVSVTVRD